MRRRQELIITTCFSLPRFEDIFRGGSGSRRNFNRAFLCTVLSQTWHPLTRLILHALAEFRHQRPQRPEAPKETDAERRARVAAEVQAIYEAEERRKEDAKREREERERLREEGTFPTYHRCQRASSHLLDLT